MVGSVAPQSHEQATAGAHVRSLVTSTSTSRLNHACVHGSVTSTQRHGTPRVSRRHEPHVRGPARRLTDACPSPTTSGVDLTETTDHERAAGLTDGRRCCRCHQRLGLTLRGLTSGRRRAQPPGPPGAGAAVRAPTVYAVRRQGRGH